MDTRFLITPEVEYFRTILEIGERSANDLLPIILIGSAVFLTFILLLSLIEDNIRGGNGNN